MYKALVSFSGLVSMKKGQVAEIKDAEVVKDLLRAGYIEEIKPAKKEVKEEIKEEVKESKENKKKK